MRIFSSRLVAALLTLALLAGGVAAQGKKKKRAKASKTAAAQTSKPATATAPTQAPQPYTGDPVPPPQAPEQGDGARRITPAEAHAAFDKGRAIIVDVRNDQAYQAGHIKGAILIPYGEISTRIKELPRDKMIITYCS
jgi:hypothetical protein